MQPRPLALTLRLPLALAGGTGSTGSTGLRDFRPSRGLHKQVTRPNQQWMTMGLKGFMGSKGISFKGFLVDLTHRIRSDRIQHRPSLHSSGYEHAYHSRTIHAWNILPILYQYMD